MIICVLLNPPSIFIRSEDTRGHIRKLIWDTGRSSNEWSVCGYAHVIAVPRAFAPTYDIMPEVFTIGSMDYSLYREPDGLYTGS